MSMYVLLTRYTADSIVDPQDMKRLNDSVRKRLAEECPSVKWQSSYVLLGPYDTLDVFDAPDNETAAKVAVIIRSFGHATTEIWPATPWKNFDVVISGLRAGEAGKTEKERADEGVMDEVDEAVAESFPASDPPAY